MVFVNLKAQICAEFFRSSWLFNSCRCVIYPEWVSSNVKTYCSFKRQTFVVITLKCPSRLQLDENSLYSLLITIECIIGKTHTTQCLSQCLVLDIFYELITSTAKRNELKADNFAIRRQYSSNLVPVSYLLSCHLSCLLCGCISLVSQICAVGRFFFIGFLYCGK